MDWKEEYERAYLAHNLKPCVVDHVGGGWFAIYDGFSRETLPYERPVFGGRYRRKQIEDMTRRLIARVEPRPNELSE
jgi:hypothetical protein